MKNYASKNHAQHYTEVLLTRFLSGGFISATVLNPPKRKLAKRISVHCSLNYKWTLLNFWSFILLQNLEQAIRKTLLDLTTKACLYYHGLIRFRKIKGD